jgi:hypothetical protein
MMNVARVSTVAIIGSIMLASMINEGQKKVREAIAEERLAEIQYNSAVAWKSIALNEYVLGLRTGIALGEFRAKRARRSTVSPQGCGEKERNNGMDIKSSARRRLLAS